MAINVSRYLGSEKLVEAVPVKKFNEKYFCKICNQLLFKVVQSGCGEIFCEACGNILSSKELMCPVENSKCKYFFDKGIEKEILALEFKCPYYTNCNWLGSLSQLKEVHFNACDYATQVCDNCKEEVIRKDLVEHRFITCAHSFFHCQLFNEKVPAKEKKVSDSLDAHYKSNFDIHIRLMMIIVQEMSLTQIKLKKELNSLKKENIALRELLQKNLV